MTTPSSNASSPTPNASSPTPIQRFRIDLGYVGTNFHGWATQPHHRTVQGELETALTTVLGQPARLTVAGRTDAGVHARRQVTHVDIPLACLPALVGQTRAGTTPRTPAQALQTRLTGVLTQQRATDIVIHAAAAVSTDFDARFSALWRSYTYRLADAESFIDPLTSAFTTRHRTELDTSAMRQAATSLLGLHDFLPFCKPREHATTIRTIHDARVTRTPERVIEIYLRADAFCHHMVRAIVGGLIRVGEGKWPVSRLGDFLDQARRGRSDFPMFVTPATGLVLEDVGYPAPGEWAVRNAQTRAMRE